jgi:hypothetical protein
MGDLAGETAQPWRAVPGPAAPHDTPQRRESAARLMEGEGSGPYRAAGCYTSFGITAGTPGLSGGSPPFTPACTPPPAWSDLEGRQGSHLEGRQGSDLEGRQGSHLEGKQGPSLEGRQGSSLEGRQGSYLDGRQGCTLPLGSSSHGGSTFPPNTPGAWSLAEPAPPTSQVIDLSTLPEIDLPTLPEIDLSNAPPALLDKIRAAARRLAETLQEGGSAMRPVESAAIRLTRGAA